MIRRFSLSAMPIPYQRNALLYHKPRFQWVEHFHGSVTLRVRSGSRRW